MKIKIKIFFVNLAIFCVVFSACFAFVSNARADYYAEGAVLSVNLLSGLSDVAQITEFTATATVPANTTVGVNFSENGTDWYNHNGIEGGWDALSAGSNSIDLGALDFTTANFYYRAKFTTTDSAATSTLSEVEVNYSDTYTPWTPPWGTGYYAEGVVLSTDLLAGTGIKFNGSESFGYNISSLPSGTTVKAQFSRDGTNFYNSSNTLWGWDTLSTGVHLSDTTSLSLSALNWTGAESFYYKLKLATTDAAQTPAVGDAGLMQKSTVINSSDLPPASKTIINMSLTDKMTDGLVGMWSFDGPDVNWSTNTAYDRSPAGGNNGTISGATAAIGKKGQALSFDSSNSNYVGMAPSSLFIFNNEIFTIGAWIKTSTAGRTIVSNYETGRLVFAVASNGKLELDTWSPYTDSYSDGTVDDGNWHYVSVTANGAGNTVNFYIDGVISGANKAIGDNTESADDPLYIGKYLASGTSYFQGQIDEVRVYNRALTAAEIGDLYRMGQVIIKR